VNRELVADLIVIGGGLGGVAAAHTAARLGQRVILVSRYEWLGGQLTTQAVPPDEHQWIETSTTSPSYRDLRTRIRDHYRRNYPLTARAQRWAELNPGLGTVSRLCHEPRAAAIVIDEMLSAAIASGRLTVLRGYETTAVSRDGDTVTAVHVRHHDGAELTLTAPLVADATELGDLLPLANVPHVIGAESATETGEMHAPEVADPLDQQAVTWCCALELRPPDEDHTIDRPAQYAHWRDTVDPRWPGSQLSWTDVTPDLLTPRTRPIFAAAPADAEGRNDDDLWHYRRILARRNLDPSFPGGEITLVNWPQIDYWELPLLGVDAETHRQALQGARSQTLALVHWMQTEAPRADGGYGYPQLRLRGDVTGTGDGLAQEVYVRESRRIRSLFTITEAHIGREMLGNTGATQFTDAVGIGYYRIDLHPSTSGRTYVDIDCFPFQIPIGALIPQGVRNLLAANKNIGTTHITNGAFRLHPVEWSIGEAVGALSAFCAAHRVDPEAVYRRPLLLEAFQHLLTGTLGLTLSWPEEIRVPQAQHDCVPLDAA
jgi:hypothetical protein